MLNSLVTYLASLPPGQTTYLMAVGPGVILLTAAFGIHHAMDASAARVRER